MIGIETLSALAAESALRNHSAQTFRRLFRGCQGGAERVGDGQTDVEPDCIGERQRPHGHPVVDRGSVDGGHGDTLVEQVDGLQQIGHEDTVDQKSRTTAHRQREPVECADRREPALNRLGSCRGAPDDLHELHPRDRVEEVQADETPRIPKTLADALERDARGIGGEQGMLGDARLHLGEQTLLELRLLRDRLDDEVGASQTLAVRVRDQPVPGCADQPWIAQALLEEAMGALHGSSDLIEREVLQGYRQTAECAPGRDVAAHHSGPDDMDPVGTRDLPAGQGLEPLLEMENAPQVRRGLAEQKLGHASGLAVEQTPCVFAVGAPVLDQSEGGRVMLLPHLGRRSAGHPLRDPAAHRRKIGQTLRKVRPAW